MAKTKGKTKVESKDKVTDELKRSRIAYRKFLDSGRLPKYKAYGRQYGKYANTNHMYDETAGIEE